MEEINSFLFVYGTLLDDSNEFAVYLKQHCNFYSKGKLSGRLYDLGEYPGAILDENTDSYIHGSIVKLIDPNETLKRLDNYEGYGDDQDQPNLFLREIALVETGNGAMNCWIYVYNFSVEGFRPIESGDYTDYKRNA